MNFAQFQRVHDLHRGDAARIVRYAVFFAYVCNFFAQPGRNNEFCPGGDRPFALAAVDHRARADFHLRERIAGISDRLLRVIGAESDLRHVQTLVQKSLQDFFCFLGVADNDERQIFFHGFLPEAIIRRCMRKILRPRGSPFP